MQTRRREGGFTLVELAVTVAVLGILAMIAIPSFVKMMPKFRLGNATSTLANEIAMARMVAIAKSVDREIVFDPAGDTYGLRNAIGGTAFATTTLAPTNLESVTYLDGSAVPAPPTLELRASGTTNVPVLKQAVLVTLATPDGTVKKRVAVWSTGRVQTQKWAGGASWVAD